MEQANECATPFEYGTNEMSLSGLQPLASHTVKAPRCKEACVTYECKLFSLQEIHVNDSAEDGQPADRGRPSTTLVIGEIDTIHVASQALDKDTMSVNLEQLRPVSRLGGVLYGSTNTVYPVPRKPKPSTCQVSERYRQHHLVGLDFHNTLYCIKGDAWTLGLSTISTPIA